MHARRRPQECRLANPHGTQIFEVGSNVIEGSLQYKYCDDVNNGVCQDYAPYCSDAPAGKEVPDESVKPSIRRYIRANLVSMLTRCARDSYRTSVRNTGSIRHWTSFRKGRFTFAADGSHLPILPMSRQVWQA